MSRKVYKYELELGRNDLELPVGAEILHLANQAGRLCLWAKVDESCDNMIHHPIVVVGTGHPLPDAELEHLGTFDVPPFVWHAFKVLLPK